MRTAWMRHFCVQFLNGKFKTYGVDVMQYYQMSLPERKHQVSVQ